MRRMAVTIVSAVAFLSGLTLQAQQAAAPAAAAGEPEYLKVRPGTALAKLIEEVQPHMRLIAASPAAKNQPEEGELPGWLRAHYLRNHPEFRDVVKANDPTGGYPLVLESMLSWMLRHQDTLQPSPRPHTLLPTRAVAVGKDVRISGPPTPGMPRSESDIRVNPKDPMKIIAGSNNLGGGNQLQYFSADGGASWGQSSLPLLDGDSMHSDPTVDWTSDGTAWATTIAIDASGAVLQLRAYRSTDGGQTWVYDGVISGGQTRTDKQLMWVDRGKDSQFKDTIYVIWHLDSPCFVGRHTSGGWLVPKQVSGAETTGSSIGGDITTNDDGAVFAIWPDTGSQKIYCARSKNGGDDFEAPKPVASTFGSYEIPLPAFANRHALIYASTAAFGKNVYVVWSDLSGDSDCDTPGEIPPGTAQTCKSRIWLARSTDGGDTWSSKVQINPASTNSDQFNQRLSVDPSTGIVGVVYYDTASAPARSKSRLVFQASGDDGATWSSPVEVASSPTDEGNPTADRLNQYGDYNGLSAADGAFFPCWTDHRDGNPEAIFSAAITVNRDPGGRVRAVVGEIAGAAPTNLPLRKRQ